MSQNNKNFIMTDGNEAAATIAYKTNEVIAIYPITPSSPMGEWADTWNATHDKNVWGTVPLVQEMQSEGGAAGAIHGALQAGAMATTFTASQGLLLMIPNMYKIAGELTPTVIHVAARSLAAQGLSIFGDHSDVMSTRGTGFALLASNSVQEAQDMALIAQAATFESRIPFLHFFDGFRTSHEVAKIEALTDDQIRSFLNEDHIQAHRGRGLTPDAPVLRGTAQNPDVYFQARETVNRFYDACPAIVQNTMDRFKAMTGRAYRLFEYVGAPNAERVILLMGSGAETAETTAAVLATKGEKVGVLKVRLYRPLDAAALLAALPASVRAIAVLDRTKEPGSAGEPLYLDVVNAVARVGQRSGVKIIGGRYGLSSKEFTPAMVKAVFDELGSSNPKPQFTVGITDDVTHLSLSVDPNFSIEPADEVRALFYGLGSDGTVSANKSSIKIIGDMDSKYAQGYFVYDSKKSGSTTVSHLRFGPRPIRAPYLIGKARFVGCHQFTLMDQFDVLEKIEDGGTFLLNSAFSPEDTWGQLPGHVRSQIVKKKLNAYVIDAYSIARACKMGGRINTIMQTAFFAISNVLPEAEAIAAIKESIAEAYGKKGEELIRMNYQAVDQTIANLHKLTIPADPGTNGHLPSAAVKGAPDFYNNVLAEIIRGKGDDLPVSVFPVDGTYPTATTKFEKRNIAQEIPVWDEKVCIQCGKCAIVCPHAVIRAKVVPVESLVQAPEGFKSVNAQNRSFPGEKFTLQVAPEDCTGCALCVDICPAKNKAEPRLKAINMHAQAPLRAAQAKNWDYFLSLPEVDRRKVKREEIRSNQLLEPLFEFSGACAGCGETPYIKLMTQLFGDRALVANATGCSSIYGGNLPTTPLAKNTQGRGPAWSNSLFEDNAEFGLGFRLAVEKKEQMAREMLQQLSGSLDAQLVSAILGNPQKDESDIYDQRQHVEALKSALAGRKDPLVGRFLTVIDALVRKSVWIIGGDGWAYDIGYGGLDHVLASGKDVNVLVLDTEVYSNTGGQMSKATPIGAVAKFAAGGKPIAKKDLGLMAMSYGHVYVTSIAMGARDEHTVRAFLEAESYRGPSLIIAYSHCIAHGIDMTTAMKDQKNAVATGYWPLYRYNPELAAQGQNPLKLDSPAPSLALEEFVYKQNRFKMLTKSHPDEARRLLDLARQQMKDRRKFYEYLAAMPGAPTPPATDPSAQPAATPSKEVAS